MSYNLAISGHFDDNTEKAEQVQAVLTEKGAEIVAALRDLDALGQYPNASTSGPGWSVNLLADPDAPKPDAGG